MANKKDKKLNVFFPYYVNQGRLLDIYAILNGGYSEYSEITTAIKNDNSINGKAELNINTGFKIFNIGGALSFDGEKGNEGTKENKEKKVQTVTSILSIVISALDDKGYLNEIKESKPGSFVCLPVVLSINSIKSLIDEMTDLLRLSEAMSGTIKNENSKGKQRNNNKNLTDALRSIKELFGGEEIIYESDDFAIVGSIVDDNLYQSVRTDIVGTELFCLAQVKRVHLEGTELMKNTYFSKIKDSEAKNAFINAVHSLTNDNQFDFEAVAVPAIHNKPVYELEIIALFQ